MRNKLKYISGLLATLLVFSVQPAFAEGPPSPSIFSNPLAITFIVLMILLVIVIGILANIVIGAAEVKLNKEKQEKNTSAAKILSLLILLIPASLFAQDVVTEVKAPKVIGGMDASTFYIMVCVLFIELATILVLLINIKFLLKKDKVVSAEDIKIAAIPKEKKISWWDKVNKLRPISEEAELDLGHEYDGIRELNNRLPPWWLYGFYATIVFAAVYLWRFEVSHNGPSQKEEYETSVAKAEIKIQQYLKKKGDLVDENTVTLLTSDEDIAAGRALFIDPSKCPACHNTDGGGNAVGPNLTDDYWINGGSVKDIFKTIKYGTSKGMRSWKDDLSAKQIAQLTSYIKTLRGTNPANAKEAQGELYTETAATTAVNDSTSVEKK